MTARKTKPSLAVIAVAGAVWVAWLMFSLRRDAVSASVDHPSPSSPVAEATAPKAEAQLMTTEPAVIGESIAVAAQTPRAPTHTASAQTERAATAVAPLSVPGEAVATAQMYAAHAPLRTPEVADPDSKANRQILQTMVTKALARSATPAPVKP